MIARICRGTDERHRVRSLDLERRTVPCPECARYFVIEKDSRAGDAVTIPEHEPVRY